MKTRNGFISNSSTTSFLLAISNKIDPRDDAFLDFFEKLIQEYDNELDCPKTMKMTVEKYTEEIIETISELKKDIAFAKKELKKIEDILSDEKLLLSLSAYEDAKMQSSIYSRRACGRDKISPKQIFEREMKMFSIALTNRGKKIEEFEKELMLISKISNPKDIKYLLKFDINHQQNKFFDQIKLMIDNKIVDVIKRETT